MSEPRILPSVKYQQKFLSADQTTNGTMSDLTFNNLEIGKTYKVILKALIRAGGTDSVNVSIIHNSNTLDRVTIRNSGGGVFDIGTAAGTAIFTAAASTLTFDASSIDDASSEIAGNGTATETYAILEEHPNHEETSQW